MQQFSESVSFDAALALHDIMGSRAHVRMLGRIGILTETETADIEAGLDELGGEIAAGRFPWKMELEDVHMNIEHALAQKVPAAAKMHTGRSRNDQVATDMRLYLREAIGEIIEKLNRGLHALIDLADEHREVFIPGYTHLQRGQPVSVAHHLLAYAEMFFRDRERFSGMLPRVNRSPLGSGALAGSTLPLDRAFVAVELGFVDEAGQPQLTENSLDAVSDRDHFFEFVSAASLAGLHLSRLAEDMILWNTAEFGFVILPDTFTTGSSLMPQKKNPDALELIRGKAARLQGNLATLAALLKNLPLSYNRDLQEDKPPVFDSFRTLAGCMEVLAALLPGLQFRLDRCAAAVADPLLLATDLADYLVERGVAFRDAHHQVGALVGLAEKTGQPIHELPQAEALTAAPGLGEDWRDVFDLKRAMARRSGVGMPGPVAVQAAIQRARQQLEK